MFRIPLTEEEMISQSEGLAKIKKEEDSKSSIAYQQLLQLFEELKQRESEYIAKIQD